VGTPYATQRANVSATVVGTELRMVSPDLIWCPQISPSPPDLRGVPTASRIDPRLLHAARVGAHARTAAPRRLDAVPSTLLAQARATYLSADGRTARLIAYGDPHRSLLTAEVAAARRALAGPLAGASVSVTGTSITLAMPMARTIREMRATLPSITATV